MSASQPASKPAADPSVAGTLEVDGDFYRLAELVEPQDMEVIGHVRTFMRERVAPVITEYWAKAEFPHQLVPEYAALGIAGACYQGFDCGGRGSVLDGLLMLELARVDCSFATFHGVHSGLAMGSIYLCGSDEQRAHWLPLMRRCEKIGAFGLTEPETGSGVARGLNTTARRDGDTWVLNGAKAWIGNATFADVVVIWARDLDDGQVKGFLVEKGTPGFTAWDVHGKLSLRASVTSGLVMNDCEIPAENILDKEGAGQSVFTASMEWERTCILASHLGMMQRVLENCVKYARERNQFGQPIGKFSAIGNKIADMDVRLETSRLVLYKAAWLKSQGRHPLRETSIAKLYVSEACVQSCLDAIQIHGGYGYMTDYQIERELRDAISGKIYSGTSEIQRVIIAGLHGF